MAVVTLMIWGTVGCGGQTRPSSSPVSATQATRRASALCSRLVVPTTAIAAQLPAAGPASAGEIARLFGAAAAFSRNVNRGLLAIHASRKWNTAVRAFVRVNAEVSLLSERVADAFRNRPASEPAVQKALMRYYKPVEEQESKAALLAATDKLPDICVPGV